MALNCERCLLSLNNTAASNAPADNVERFAHRPAAVMRIEIIQPRNSSRSMGWCSESAVAILEYDHRKPTAIVAEVKIDVARTGEPASVPFTCYVEPVSSTDQDRSSEHRCKRPTRGTCT